jgi:hypothetical protein
VISANISLTAPSRWQSAVVDENAENSEDGVPALAGLLDVPEPDLRAAIGGPWSVGHEGPDLGSPVTTFTGLVNPRAPSRPLVAIRVEHEDWSVDVGHAVGVPVPTGRMQWALGEPRTALSFDPDEPRELLLAELREAVHQVAEAAVLRGTAW